MCVSACVRVCVCVCVCMCVCVCTRVHVHLEALNIMQRDRNNAMNAGLNAPPHVCLYN